MAAIEELKNRLTEFNVEKHEVDCSFNDVDVT